MNMFQSIINYLKKKEEGVNETPEGFCPNCWGRQEYEGQFFEALENENVSVNNINEKKGWILDYAEKNLSSIQLKHENDQLVCLKCKLNYAPVK